MGDGRCIFRATGVEAVVTAPVTLKVRDICARDTGDVKFRLLVREENVFGLAFVVCEHHNAVLNLLARTLRSDSLSGVSGRRRALSRKNSQLDEVHVHFGPVTLFSDGQFIANQRRRSVGRMLDRTCELSLMARRRNSEKIRIDTRHSDDCV